MDQLFSLFQKLIPFFVIGVLFFLKIYSHVEYVSWSHLKNNASCCLIP